jgi:predicted nucleotidyltransferase
MRTADILADALFTRAQAALLGLFYSHPDEAFYLRQVIERTRLGVGHAQRELARLSAAGVLERTLVGRHVFFQAARACPIYEELRSIVGKTVGAASVIRQSLERLADRITVAFIFGSVAAGTERKAGDVDLMIVGSVGLQQVVDALKPAEMKLAREINPVVYPEKEFRDKLARHQHFLSSVMKANKRFVLGEGHELAGLCEERLDPAPPDVQRRNCKAAGNRRSRHPAKQGGRTRA